MVFEKVLTKHKGKSIYRNIIGIRFEDGHEQEVDFSTDVDEWTEDLGETVERSEPCCAVLHTKVLTKAQARLRPGLNEAMDKEIKKV